MIHSRIRNFVLGCLLGIYLFGCSDVPKIPGGTASFEQTSTQVEPNGTTNTTTTKVVVEQPDNAVTGGTLSIKPQADGTVAVETATGQSEKPSAVAGIMSLAQTLSPVVYVGAGLMALGAFVFIFGDKKGALVLFGFGAAMAGGAYLFQAYSGLFLLLLLGAVGWLGYTLWHKRQVGKELIKTVEIVKGRLSEQDRNDLFKGKEGIKPLIASVQTAPTVRFFNDLKKQGVV